MNTPFVQKPLTEHKTKFKLFGSTPNPNAVIEINNLLASKHVLEISMKEVQSIVFKYRVNLKRHFPNELKEFYEEFFKHCLDDKFLSDEEVTELLHLKRILTLNDRDVDEIHNKIAGEIYQKAVDEVLDDAVLDPEEKTFLESLQKDLRLNSAFADKLYKEKAGDILHKLIDEALEDVLLTPEEEMEIAELAANLNIDYKENEKTHLELEKFKLFWQIENGEMPELNVKVDLEEGETCYFRTEVDLMEEFVKTDKPYYRGAEMNEKIASGIYWKAGRLGSYDLPEDVWQIKDSGKLYITSQRLIFAGEQEEISVPLEFVLDFESFKNGVEIKIHKNEIHPFLKFEKNIDLFSIIFGNAIINNENGFFNDGVDFL